MLLEKAITDKPYTDASLKASACANLLRHRDELVCEECEYVHSGLYRLLNAPLTDRYPVIS